MWRRYAESPKTLNLACWRARDLPEPPDLLDAAAGISQAFGLLTNDALIVAVMQANSLSYLASNDADFDRVPGLTRYAPV
jgi:predicted nucleic acid-binding protein